MESNIHPDIIARILVFRFCLRAGKIIFAGRWIRTGFTRSSRDISKVLVNFPSKQGLAPLLPLTISCGLLFGQFRLCQKSPGFAGQVSLMEAQVCL